MLKILHISRQTLVKYVQNKEIRVVELPNGFYDYNDDDVYYKAGLTNERLNVTYARVSTAKQKKKTSQIKSRRLLITATKTE